jgi:hypothetical protein
MKLSRREERKAQATAAEEGSLEWKEWDGEERRKSEYNNGGEAILIFIFKLLDAHVEDPCVLALSV